MFKIVDLGSWDKIAESPASIIPMSDTFSYGDQKTYRYKRASSLQFINKIADYDLKPGEIPIHVIAIGSTEKYGPNRNGDGFKEATCISQHPTFVKHGRFFRHHKSKEPEKNYGKIAESYYNPEMGRIELLVIGNGTKQAADRNGGLVMPDTTLNKLASGDPVAWSMGCKLAFDKCAICGHEAKTPADYCTEDTCINPKTGEHHPGCRHGLTKISSDGYQQYVENPNCDFYDISEVGIPADRTAYGFKADYLKKAASAQHVLGGAELAAMRGFSFDMGDTVTSLHKIGMLQKAIYKLAACEDIVNSDNARTNLFKVASILSPQSSDLINELRGLSKGRLDSALHKLASQGVILSPENYLRLKNAQVANVAPFALRKYLQNVYNSLSNVDSLDKLSSYMLGDGLDSNCPSFTNSMNKLASAESFTERNLTYKISTACLKDNQGLDVAADVDLDLAKIAMSYALYKAAALCEVPEKNQDFVALVSVCDNCLVL